MTKHIRMTITTTVELTMPLADNEQHLNTLTDADRDNTRKRMKAQILGEQAKGTKVKNIVISRITLLDIP